MHLSVIAKCEISYVVDLLTTGGDSSVVKCPLEGWVIDSRPLSESP